MIWSVWAIDPGARTGWAWACLSSTELGRADPLQLLAAVNPDRFTMGEITAPVRDTALRLDGAMAAVDGRLRRLWPGMRYVKVLAMEGFVMSPGAKNSSAGFPERVLAAVRQQSAGRFDEVVEQMPSAKAVVNDDRLKRHGLWVRGKPHAMDATRHLVVRLRTLAA